MSNKIVTSVSALTDDNIDNISDNNVVCIDIEQGFIGVHKSNPICEIDVSGTINCTGTIDCSILRIAGVPINPAGAVDFINLETDLIPIETNTYTIGSKKRLWDKAYINSANIDKLTVLSSTNRLYQEIKDDISWNAVNGYYGLAKEAYPALDPVSCGAKAILNWTSRTVPDASWYGVCWSPELGIFVAVADNNPNDDDDTQKVMTSPDGINWTLGESIENNSWSSVCWSPELHLFVAVASSGDNGIMTSSNGIDWEIDTETTVGGRSVCWSPELGIFVAVSENRVIISPDGSTWTSIKVKTNNWNSVCWSPELGIFVAVAISINNDGVITSSDGITWTSRTTPDTGCNSVCWSSELGIFVAVASVSNINTTIMTSYNGINWTIATTGGPGLTSVCWSPQLGIFVAVGPNSVMTSANGTSWIVINTVSSNWQNICWSPELGIFVAVADTKPMVMTSSLKGRPPTSYNVFDSSFNKIDENGKWTFSDVIISNAIEVPNNSIVGEKIATGSINLTKLGTSITSVLDAKAPSANPSFSGTITIPSGVSISSNSVTVTSAQLAFVSGATRNIQTQLTELSNNKVNSANPSFSGTITIPSGVNISSNSVTVTSAQLAFVSGATSNIQNQLTNLSNNKANSANPTFTGTVVLPANTINSSHIIIGSILGEDICSNTITDTNIAVGTITELKLASAVQTKLNAVGTIADGSITAAKLATALLNRIYNLEYPGFYGSLIIQNSNTSGAGAIITFTLISQTLAGNIQLLGSTTLTVNQQIYVPILIQNRLLNKDTSFNIVYSTTSRTITSTILTGISVITPIVSPNIYFSVLPAFIHNGTIQLTIVLPEPKTGFYGTLIVHNVNGGNGGRYLDYQWLVNGTPLNSITRIYTGNQSPITISEINRLTNIGVQLTLNVTFESDSAVNNFTFNGATNVGDNYYQKIFTANSNNLTAGTINVYFTINNTYVAPPPPGPAPAPGPAPGPPSS
jgi:hypothetical protein